MITSALLWNQIITEKNCAMFFKYTCLGNAAGGLGLLVIYIEIKDMPDEKMFVRKVIGLSHTDDLGGSGYLVFIPKRGGNLASNKWLHKDYFIPTIKQSDILFETVTNGHVCN
jgi:hypothetical protein